MSDFEKPIVEIDYCIRCKWRLRAAWYAQELLSTFETDLGSVALAPSDIAGFFRIVVDGKTVFDRATDGGFIEAKILKQRVRDIVAPQRPLGHVDN